MIEIIWNRIFLELYTRSIIVGLFIDYIIFSSSILVDYNECSNPVDYPCVGNQVCINTVGSYTCNCSIGYQFNVSQQQCVGKCSIANIHTRITLIILKNLVWLNLDTIIFFIFIWKSIKVLSYPRILP